MKLFTRGPSFSICFSRDQAAVMEGELQALVE